MFVRLHLALFSAGGPLHPVSLLRVGVSCVACVACVCLCLASALCLSAPMLFGVSLVPLCNTPSPLSPARCDHRLLSRWPCTRPPHPHPRRPCPGPRGPSTRPSWIGRGSCLHRLGEFRACRPSVPSRPHGPWGTGGHPCCFSRPNVVGDVSVIHPVAVSFAAGAALTPGFAAAALDRTKQRAYHQASLALPFVPLLVQSFGLVPRPFRCSGSWLTRRCRLAGLVCPALRSSWGLFGSALPLDAATCPCISRGCTLPRRPLIGSFCMGSPSRKQPRLLSAAMGGCVFLSPCGACLCGAGLVLPRFGCGLGFPGLASLCAWRWLRAGFVCSLWTSP
jgi:hypothetical protein